MNKTIFITGTPCTGKTTVSESLKNKLDCNLIKINDLAIENDFILGIDDEKGYKIIDIPKLNDKVSEIIDESEGLIIFEGHLSHLCSGADKVIVLRVDPDTLKLRLSQRGYSESKINENLEAEAMGICSTESYMEYGENTQEIDVTALSIDDVVSLITEIIDGKSNYPVGEVDFMEWLISNH